ncbi:thioredoxin family protein [Solimonas terrae]|uniref:Thioredoxin n=1 Tax=Solimonas terrae TaxID=1396819 RepID=A0A6M2BM77_9GAMM|nr:thioredoxin family protein [Solimonas terrae]NGY03199.1 thioredoxin family protein [Solimonas terrae]
MNVAGSPSPIAELRVDDFSVQSADAEAPLVVHFWAPWCAPCAMLKPVFEQAAAMRGDLRFASCDIDEQPELARELAIRNLPTLAIYHRGLERARISGTMRLGSLLDWFDRHRVSAQAG